MSEEQIRQLIREAVQPKPTTVPPTHPAPAPSSSTIIVGLTAAALLAIIALVGIVAVVR